ncbi:hypothetical protein [Nocardioides pyridinolyticus]
MPEAKRFDPLGWLLSVSFAVLTAVGALALAVWLARQIWPWLAAGAAIGLVLVTLVRLGLWWSRRQSW